jgi:aminoglycoside phosphotransferase (APT) family kinase protein
LWDAGEHQELPPEVSEAKKRQQKLLEVLAKLQQADAARKKDGIDPKKNPAQMPKADGDAKVMPNKEGGYAPNFTPVAAVVGKKGSKIRKTWRHSSQNSSRPAH